MTRQSIFRITVFVLSLTCLALPARSDTPRDLPVSHLKTAYLICETQALTSELPDSEIARCSVIYERLKQEIFDGDWRRVRAWTTEAMRPGRGT